jgi:hypothetical protein
LPAEKDVLVDAAAAILAARKLLLSDLDNRETRRRTGVRHATDH